MVEEVVGKDLFPRFMIYDVITLNVIFHSHVDTNSYIKGKYVGNNAFWQRYHDIRVHLIEPRDYYVFQKNTFSIKLR